ncbi:Predicted transcriptional regulator, contains HTH domain [Halogranum gelatinilyticum]|uniref:Predicted transcriptional regulator, contains HTH domain n=1 Tax=Halogranum gelatinilyticum TaxID=660521 RepID=A0A1G9WMT7_9EURY|nr:hypothetical protein [Halogranum gelatinilyticum]SDM85476.1 Predicted transcriptional regulator, contains HTH domain [Halogranum gelatinilyticum]
MNAREDIAFLVGSASRIRIFQAVAEQPATPTSLADRCSCARETAQRTLSGFVQRGWIAKENGQYELTVGGESVLEQYERLTGVVDGASRLQQFLTNAGATADGFPIAAVADDDGVTVTTATAEDPHAPIDRYLTFLGTEPVGSFKGVSPIVSRVFNEAAETIIGEKTEVELIIDESVLSVSESEYPDALRRVGELEQFTLLVAPEEICVGVALIDGRAFVGAYDGHNNLVATVDGRNDQLVTWTTSLYESYRESATQLDLTPA